MYKIFITCLNSFFVNLSAKYELFEFFNPNVDVNMAGHSSGHAFRETRALNTHPDHIKGYPSPTGTNIH